MLPLSMKKMTVVCTHCESTSDAKQMTGLTVQTPEPTGPEMGMGNLLSSPDGDRGGHTAGARDITAGQEKQTNNSVEDRKTMTSSTGTQEHHARDKVQADAIFRCSCVPITRQQAPSL